jgi:hypothetical protein
LNSREKATVDRTFICEKSMDTVDRRAGIFRCFQREFDVNTPDDENTVFVLYLTAHIRSQPAITRIDLTRFQRATKGSEHSAAGGCDNVVDRCGMGFRQVLFINSVVPCNLVVDAEYYGIRFAGQLGDTKRAFLSLNANVGDVDDLGIHMSIV